VPVTKASFNWVISGTAKIQSRTGKTDRYVIVAYSTAILVDMTSMGFSLDGDHCGRHGYPIREAQ
jgi:hypothetical protein